MTALSLLIAIVVHSIIIIWIARRVARWHVPRWLVFILSFTIFGTALGLITMAITMALPLHAVHHFVNPFGVGFADWIHDDWSSNLNRPDNWESILPWALKYPQWHFFSSAVLGAIFGTILTFGAMFTGDKAYRAIGIGADILPDTIGR